MLERLPGLAPGSSAWRADALLLELQAHDLYELKWMDPTVFPTVGSIPLFFASSPIVKGWRLAHGHRYSARPRVIPMATDGGVQQKTPRSFPSAGFCCSQDEGVTSCFHPALGPRLSGSAILVRNRFFEITEA